MNTIAKQYSIELKQNHTDSLVENTDAFEITGIQALLEQFPKTKNELGLYLKNINSEKLSGKKCISTPISVW